MGRGETKERQTQIPSGEDNQKAGRQPGPRAARGTGYLEVSIFRSMEKVFLLSKELMVWVLLFLPFCSAQIS